MVVLATIVTCTFVLYAPLNEVVHRRRTSVAVQLALGARPRQALRFLATGLAGAAVVGGSTGLLLGLGAARLVAAVVPRVGPFELSGFVVCVATIFLSVGVAMVGPLRLVARADLATLQRGHVTMRRKHDLTAEGIEHEGRRSPFADAGRSERSPVVQGCHPPFGVVTRRSA